MGNGAALLAGLGQGVDRFAQNYYRMKGIKRQEQMQDEDRSARASYLSGRYPDQSSAGPAASADAIPGQASPAILSSRTPGGPSQANALQRAQREAASYDRPGMANLYARAGRVDQQNAEAKPQLHQGFREFQDIEKKKAQLPVAFKKLSIKRNVALQKLQKDDLYQMATGEQKEEMEANATLGVDQQIEDLQRQKGFLESEKGRKITEMMQLAIKLNPMIGKLIEQLFAQGDMERAGTQSRIKGLMKPISANMLR